jgi:hypothetical protein
VNRRSFIRFLGIAPAVAATGTISPPSLEPPRRREWYSLVLDSNGHITGIKLIRDGVACDFVGYEITGAAHDS